ncbi:MAG: ABC transporter permease [Candidatus Porifericomitaceae bacterium WSBS_2022_MAG_OTU9]
MAFLPDVLTEAFWLIVSLDPELLFVSGVSLGVALLSTFLASCIGVPFSLFFFFGRWPGKGIVQALLNLLMAVPTVVIGLLLYGLLSRSGPLGELDLLYTRTAIVIGQMLLILPIICNLSISVIAHANPGIVYSCRLLGANRLQQALVLLYEVRYGLVIAVITAFGRAISEVGIAMLVGGNIEGVTRTLTTAIVMDASRGEIEAAFALGVVLLLIAFIVTLSLQKLRGRVPLL